MIYVKHAPKCPDRDGCPFDARRCACWRLGCALVFTGEMEQAIELAAWRRKHIDGAL